MATQVKTKEEKAQYAKLEHQRNRESYNRRKRKYSKLLREQGSELEIRIRKMRAKFSRYLRLERSNETSMLRSLIGCSPQQWRDHLTQTALSRYGSDYLHMKMEIDHIIPWSTVTTEEEYLKVGHYTNTQWLSPQDNQRKRDNEGYSKDKK